MEEVIEQLRELNEPVPVPLELPDDELLVEIEEQLLINLPFELREFLLKVSDVVYGRLEPVTATDPQSHTYLPEVASVAWDLGVPATWYRSARTAATTTWSTWKAKCCSGQAKRAT